MKPFVSIIIPCRNEAAYLGRCLDSILANDYPPDRLEILVADGMSRDGSREIAARYPPVRIIDKARGATPAALNLAIDQARGDVILRLDAHSAIAPDYISRSVERLESGAADNVGGAMITEPSTHGLFAEPIRVALSTWFGVGNSRFRTGALQPGYVDTVFGGCWRREVFSRIGKFNERLLRGQDLEFNLRLRRAGGKILLDPAIRSRYFARATLRAFARHNWTNGVWAILPFAYSATTPVRWRHVAPLGLVLTLLFAPRPIREAAAALYLASNLTFSIAAAVREKKARLAALLPCTYMTLHFCYGAGSLWGALRWLGTWLESARREETAA